MGEVKQGNEESDKRKQEFDVMGLISERTAKSRDPSDR
jgi:hypothetical protein